MMAPSQVNWVNDGYADCGDTDGDGISDDEGVSGWYSTIEELRDICRRRENTPSHGRTPRTAV